MPFFSTSSPVKNLGIGLGLRAPHIETILSTLPPVDWFEIISENYLFEGKPKHTLERILEHYPVVMHGVTLAIGSPEPLNFTYLKKLKELARFTQTPWVSDHLCWGKLKGAYFHDLLPLPRTKDVIAYVAERARIVQDFLEVPFALENLSSYAEFHEDAMSEAAFYREVVEKADIWMMLDVNNIYVSAFNNDFDPLDYIKETPLERVLQIHLAGHSRQEKVIIDTHDNYVCDEVWELYRKVYPQTRGVSTLLEWDDNFLPFEETWQEALKAKNFQESFLREKTGALYG